jgi:hypothetical protein
MSCAVNASSRQVIKSDRSASTVFGSYRRIGQMKIVRP